MKNFGNITCILLGCCYWTAGSCFIAEYFVLLVKKSPQALLFRTCGEDHFENSV
jgi:hypothetical protein